MKPGEFARMSGREKAVLTGFIDVRVKEREQMLRSLQA